MRKKRSGEVRKHDCGAGVAIPKPKRNENKRAVCEMELRGIIEAPIYEDEQLSAH
jgi:hypothetical protein